MRFTETLRPVEVHGENGLADKIRRIGQSAMAMQFEYARELRPDPLLQDIRDEAAAKTMTTEDLELPEDGEALAASWERIVQETKAEDPEWTARFDDEAGAEYN